MTGRGGRQPTHAASYSTSNNRTSGALRAERRGLCPCLRRRGIDGRPLGPRHAPRGAPCPFGLSLGARRHRGAPPPRVGLRFPFGHGALDRGGLRLPRDAPGNPDDGDLRSPDRFPDAGDLLGVRRRARHAATTALSNLVRDPHARRGPGLRRVLRIGDLRGSLPPHVSRDQGQPPLVLLPAHAAFRDARPHERERGERGAGASGARDLDGNRLGAPRRGRSGEGSQDLAHDRRLARPRLRRPRVSPPWLAGTAGGLCLAGGIHHPPRLTHRDRPLRPLVPHLPVTPVAETEAPTLDLFCVGLNHETSPLEIRDALVLNDEEVGRAIQALRERAGASEALVISTCNRTEVYARGSSIQDPPAFVADLLREIKGMDLTGPRGSYLYAYREPDSVRHLFRVACGLDSQVLGEPQITGQVKDSLSLAAKLGGTGPVIERLLDAALRSAKRARTETGI